jgi:hypothetical protein
VSDVLSGVFSLVVVGEIFLIRRLARRNGRHEAAAEEIKPEAEQALWWRKAKLEALRARELKSLK